MDHPPPLPHRNCAVRMCGLTLERPDTVDPGAGADVLSGDGEDLVPLHQPAPAATSPVQTVPPCHLVSPCHVVSPYQVVAIMPRGVNMPRGATMPRGGR